MRTLLLELIQPAREATSQIIEDPGRASSMTRHRLAINSLLAAGIFHASEVDRRKATTTVLIVSMMVMTIGLLGRWSCTPWPAHRTE